MVYPVGSVYLNYSSSTNPATLFGVGTWSLMYDRVIIGAGSGYGLNTTGGATTSSGSTSLQLHLEIFQTTTTFGNDIMQVQVVV